jgi:hypothetical protein
MFGTSYDTSSDKFQNYYKDLSLRLKNRQIDLVIVCNMFCSCCISVLTRLPPGRRAGCWHALPVNGS